MSTDPDSLRFGRITMVPDDSQCNWCRMGLFGYFSFFKDKRLHGNLGLLALTDNPACPLLHFCLLWRCTALHFNHH